MVTISPRSNVQAVIVRFVVEPSRTQDLLDQIHQYMENVVKKFPGFVSSTLHRSQDGTRVINYAQWESLSAYRNFVEQSLQRNPPPIFKEFPPETMPFEIVEQFVAPRSCDKGLSTGLPGALRAAWRSALSRRPRVVY